VRNRLVVLFSVAVLAASAGPASAETWHARDGHGDVRSYQLDLTQECEAVTGGERVAQDRRHDITRISVDHGSDALVAKIGLRDLPRKGPGMNYDYDVDVRTPDHTFDVSVVVESASGRVETSLGMVRRSRDPDAPHCGPRLEYLERDCAGLATEVDRRSNSVSVTVPRVCLGDPRWVRVGAVAAGVGGGGFGDGSDLMVLADAWGPSEFAITRLLPPLGPRVHVG
jgi:hypothetical protein